MKDVRTVSVKMGKPYLWVEDTEEYRNSAIESAKEDAKERIIDAYPYITNISYEVNVVRNDYLERWEARASASGELVRTNKKLRKLLIEDIRKTHFYRCVMEEIKDDSVSSYNLNYCAKYESKPCINISGKGDINWDRIQKDINDHNDREYNFWKTNHKYQAFYVYLDSLYTDIFLLDSTWSGTINLKNGDWVSIEAGDGGSWDDDTVILVNRYSKPKQVTTNDYEFVVHKD